MKISPAKISLLYIVLFGLLTSCSTTRYPSKNSKETTISAIKFLDEYVMPADVEFKGTLVGGLSGIDYDAENNRYFLISDDPSQFSKARIYTASIDIKNNKIDTIFINGIIPILQENGQEYPKHGTVRSLKADGESVRYNPIRNELIWSNEGERLFRSGDSTIIQPAITILSADGKFLDTIPLPKGFHFTKGENGPRKNALFEGVTFADNYKTLYASLEEPLYQDGRAAAFEFDGAITRILKFDTKNKRNTAQYAYNLGELPVEPTTQSDWNLNGISEILAINNHTLMVIERAWAKGHDDHTFVKLFLVDLNEAENVIDNDSFSKNKPRVLKKKLLFDFDKIDKHIDNFEGVTFGPNLPNGNKTLIFCVDNNFSKNQTQQFFLFEVEP